MAVSLAGYVTNYQFLCKWQETSIEHLNKTLIIKTFVQSKVWIWTLETATQLTRHMIKNSYMTLNWFVISSCLRRIKYIFYNQKHWYLSISGSNTSFENKQQLIMKDDSVTFVHSLYLKINLRQLQRWMRDCNFI